MKKMNQILLGTALLAALAFTTSCKKTGDPGPAGANGKDGNRYPYNQQGTTLNISGNFNSDDASFDKLLSLPFFATLDENRVEVSAPALRNAGSMRTSASSENNRFYITRYDSLGNSTLSFDIWYSYNGTVYVNDFYFNVKTYITETSYKNVYTTYGGGLERVSGPYDQQSGLSEDDMNYDGNSFSISNWSYDETTKVLSFDYSGTLTSAYNSTGNDLDVSGTVKANVKEASLRTAQ